MTIQLNDLGQVYLVYGKTDMRQGIDSLAYLVKSQFNLDPFSGQVYLFCGGQSPHFRAGGLAHERIFYQSKNKCFKKS
ncbi:TPA: IS66 family insertion sequence element accessory protein TnpB [Streptococcus suis]